MRYPFEVIWSRIGGEVVTPPRYANHRAERHGIPFANSLSFSLRLDGLRCIRSHTPGHIFDHHRDFQLENRHTLDFTGTLQESRIKALYYKLVLQNHLNKSALPIFKPFHGIFGRQACITTNHYFVLQTQGKRRPIGRLLIIILPLR